MDGNDPAKEWGLPDWRDEGSYTNTFGPPDQWTDDRWRWEFKRRLPDYRAAFDKYVEQGREGTIHRDSITRQDEKGRLIMVEPSHNTPTHVDDANELGFAFAASDEHREQFGMFFLPNPRFSGQPNNALLFGDRLMTASRDEDGRLIGEANWHFDLTKPLKPQLKRCEDNLARLQNALKQQGLNEKKRADKWFQYLRILDASECGASYSEMLVLVPMKRKAPQSSRDTLAAAIAVRNKL